MGQNKYVKVYNSGRPQYSNEEYINGRYKILGGNRDEWHLCNGAGRTFYARRDDCSEPLAGDIAEILGTEPIENPKRKEEHYELWPGAEAFDVMKATLSQEEFIGFLKGNILKYQLRLGKKKGEPIEKDLQKINTYKQILKESL